MSPSSSDNPPPSGAISSPIRLCSSYPNPTLILPQSYTHPTLILPQSYPNPTPILPSSYHHPTPILHSFYHNHTLIQKLNQKLNQKLILPQSYHNPTLIQTAHLTLIQPRGHPSAPAHTGHYLSAAPVQHRSSFQATSDKNNKDDIYPRCRRHVP
jgi:hypothetical protein